MYASQGRYGGASQFGSGGGGGRWSGQQPPQAVPAGQGGFRSALSTFKGAGAGAVNNGFSRPSSSAPPRTGFKPPIPSASLPQRTASLGTPAVRPSLAATAGIPLAPIPQSRPAVDGPPGIVETRGSLVNEAVLLNPKLSAPGPSKSNDLLASFQKGAEDDLNTFMRLGAGAAPPAEPDTAPIPAPVGKAPPMSPKAKGGRKRAAAPAATAAKATRKKAKK